jgi:hypothetical protein
VTYVANVTTILGDCAAIAAVSVPAADYVQTVRVLQSEYLFLVIVLVLMITVFSLPIAFVILLQKVVQNEFMYYRFMQHGLLVDYGGRKPSSAPWLMNFIIGLIGILLVLVLSQLATGRIGWWDFVARFGSIAALGMALYYRVLTDVDIESRLLPIGSLVRNDMKGAMALYYRVLTDVDTESRLLPIGSLVRNDMKGAMDFIGSLKICGDHALVPYVAYAAIMARARKEKKLPEAAWPWPKRLPRLPPIEGVWSGAPRRAYLGPIEPSACLLSQGQKVTVRTCNVETCCIRNTRA